MTKWRGFTLIEILVVMVIISIVASVAIITLSSNQNKTYQMMAQQLADRLILAEQEAMLRPATLGLAFTRHSFRFYLFQHPSNGGRSTWLPLEQSAFGLRHIPAHTEITLIVQGRIIPANGQPALIISPSNDLTPFVILIGKTHETPYYQIIGKENGEVSSARFSTK